VKKRIVLEIVLICILGITGWYLFDNMKQVELNSPERKSIENFNRLVFSDGAGIDVMGNYIDSVLTNKVDGEESFVAAFLLRYNSLDSDLIFWNEVKKHLFDLDVATVRLIAYCENSQCVEAIRENPNVTSIPILEYGEVSDMQAVISADATGDFWLFGKQYKKIEWRNADLSPFDIATSIGFGL